MGSSALKLAFSGGGLLLVLTPETLGSYVREREEEVTLNTVAEQAVRSLIRASMEARMKKRKKSGSN